MIKVTKYPKVNRLSVIDSTDNGGFVQVQIYGNYEDYNLTLNQDIFVFTGSIVGKFKITGLSVVNDFSFITIDKVYVSDTSGGFLLTDYSVNANSSWRSANYKIEFEFERQDIQIRSVNSTIGTSTEFESTKKIISFIIDGNYTDYDLIVGNNVYIEVKDSESNELVFFGVKSILQATYDSSQDISSIWLERAEDVQFSNGVGFVNSNDLKTNYFATVRVETKGDYKEFKVPADASGKMRIDVSKYLRTKIRIADIFDYSTVSFNDDNLGGSYTISFSENYN